MPIIIQTPDSSAVLLNPNGYQIFNLDNSHDGSYAGHIVQPAVCNNPNSLNPRICTGVDGDALGVRLQYNFSPSVPASKIRLHNNGGAVLDDCDGWGQFDYEIFDSANVLVASGTLMGINGAAPSEDTFGFISDVSRFEVFNITQIPCGAGSQNGIWWRELELITPDIECDPVSNITRDSATIAWEGLAVAAGNFYRVMWGTQAGGPYPFSTDILPTDGDDPDPTTLDINNLEPDTTYFYQVCLLDGDAFTDPGTDGQQTTAQQYNVFPICVECSFTTLPAESWCGGEYDPDQCVGVDIDGDGDDDYQRCLFI